MKKLVLLCFIFFGILSCKEPTAKKMSVSFDKIEVSKKIFADNDSTKPYMQIALSLEYPVKCQNDTILEKLQKIFAFAFTDGEYDKLSPQGAIDSCVVEFTDSGLELAKALDDDWQFFGECFINVKTTVIDSTTLNNVLIVETTKSSYMGGAHGSSSTDYYCIDLDDVRILSEKDIFEPGFETKLPHLFSKALVQRYGDSLAYIVFDHEQIQPNGNFIFKPTCLTYAFNEYEIGPYSSGLITIDIPYSAINSLLKPKYQMKQEN